MSPDGVRVASLTRYPVKACAGEDLEVTELGPAGVPGDRVLAVAVGDAIVTQRDLAGLALVVPRLREASGRLGLSLGGAGALDPVEGTLDTSGARRTVTLFGEPVEVVEQDPALSAWLARVLGADTVLVAAPAGTRRRSPGLVEGETVLSDEGTLSLHSRASLDRLNDALAERGQPALPADRFRANLVLEGCAAHAEDRTTRFHLDGVELAFAQPDERCVVTTVDQATGRRDGPEPIRTLATYRRLESGGVGFGVYVAVTRPGVVRVGDGVRLEESARHQ